MDKETLSQYGWVVIMIIVLVIIIAFASPFGKFVADNFSPIYQIFRSAADESLSSVQSE